MGDEILNEARDAEAAVPPKRGRSRIWVVIVAFVVIAGVAFAGYVGLSEMSRVSSAEAKLDEALDLLASVEDAVVAVDEVVQAEITPALEATATAALELVPQAREDLEEAIELLTEARVDLREDDQVLAQALQTAAEARRDMLEEAEPILSANIAAAAALSPATEAWDLVAEAEKLSTDAVAEYNKHSTEGVKKSTELSKQAVEKLAAARSALETATVAFSEADLQQFVDYIDARDELLDLSMQIDAKWLEDKVAEANAMLDDYSEKEEALIEQGKALPASPSVAIADAYEALASEATDRYYAARDRARSADEQVRELSTTTTGE